MCIVIYAWLAVYESHALTVLKVMVNVSVM